MTNLIITVMAIALTAAVGLMGAAYVSQNSFKSKEYRYEIESGLVNLKVAYDMYVSQKQEKPSLLDWRTELAAVRGDVDMVPELVQDLFSWTYDIVSRRPYFCLAGVYEKTAFKGMSDARKNSKYGDLIFINSFCGATVDDTEVNIEATSILTLTYWIKK